MKKNKKVPLAKKPLLVLSRRAVLGWGGVIFLICAWMFVIGVLVGRGTAPVKFDVDKLQKTFKASKQNLAKQGLGRTQNEVGIEKDKTQLDFYEALEENREDVKINKTKPSQEAIKKEEPPVGKKRPISDGKSAKIKIQTPKTVQTKSLPKRRIASKSKTEPAVNVYTIQAASVRAAGDADKLIAKLKAQGFPAYRAIGKIPGKGIWYRVRVGDYKSRADARRMLEKLKKAGLKPIIVEK
jgi:cell division protein FtsN